MMQCILPQSQTTPEKTLSNPWFGKGFCEPDQYKAAIDRCDGGYRSCELGIEIYRDLTKILDNCSAALRQWAETSEKQIGQSKEFGTTKKTWIHTVRAVQKLAERNVDVSQNVQKTVIDKMVSYKNENYGKSYIHVKKIREFEKEFKKTQKSWLELIDRINEAKQKFHASKLKLQSELGSERVTASDVGSSEEQIRNAKLRVETRQKETEKYRTKYQNLIEEMEKTKPSYQQQMFKILENMDDFERKRLRHFNEMFNSLQIATAIDKDKKHGEMAIAFKAAIDDHDIEADIGFFNKNYGKETKTTWPKFEDLKD
ncbi:hypothetical protein I4U23_000666 [Adineta vaga]|nr:hypothetical protein I4U23_000666 [Adineta vaga]